MLSLVLLLCLLADDKPSALVAFEQARRAVHGNFEWSVAPKGNFDAEMLFVSRHAQNGDMIFENRGDPNGWTRHNPQTGDGVHRFPQLYLVTQDSMWHYETTSPSAHYWKPGAAPSPWISDVRDVRGLGMFPRSGTMDFSKGIEAIWGTFDDPIIRWKQEMRDGVYVVTGENRLGIRLTWYIDPERGWNAERIVAIAGNDRWEAVSKLTKYSEQWFPETTHYYTNGELTEVVQIHSFDSETSAARLTPADLGLEPGINVDALDSPDQESGLTWDGEKAIRHLDWLADVKAGRKDWGPLRKAQTARGGQFESPYLTEQQRQISRDFRTLIRIRQAIGHHSGEWGRFVNEFVARYELNDKQIEAARRIYRECVDSADEVIQRRRPQILEAVERSESVKQSGTPEQKEKSAEELRRLRAPIDRIFAERLKPRLEKIPTMAQRREAELRANGRAAHDAAKTDNEKQPDESQRATTNPVENTPTQQP